MLQFDVGIRLYEHLSEMHQVFVIYLLFSYFVYSISLFIIMSGKSRMFVGLSAH